MVYPRSGATLDGARGFFTLVICGCGLCQCDNCVTILFGRVVFSVLDQLFVVGTLPHRFCAWNSARNSCHSESCSNHFNPERNRTCAVVSDFAMHNEFFPPSRFSPSLP